MFLKHKNIFFLPSNFILIARLMWRREGDGTVYLYAPYNQADGFWWDFNFLILIFDVTSKLITSKLITSKNQFRTRYFRLLTDFEVAYIAKWFISDMNHFLTHLFHRAQNVLQSLKVIDQAIIVTLTMEAIFQGLTLIKSLNLFYL